MNKLNLLDLQHLGKSYDREDTHGRKFKIWIPEALSKYCDKLIVNQMHVIKAGRTELDEVTKMERHINVQTLGFLVEEPKLVCIAMEFSQKDIKWYNHFAVSYAFQGYTCIAGVVLLDPGVSLDIPVGTYDWRLSELDQLYYPILECYDKDRPPEHASTCPKSPNKRREESLE